MVKKEAVKNVEPSINELLTNISKKYGKSICYRGKDKFLEDVETIPTPLNSINDALGIGGLPKGRFIEAFGQESSCKTTFCLQTIGLVQKNRGTCAFIDPEHALELRWAKICGVDTDELLISQPDYGEQALDIVEDMIRSEAVDLIVVDSVAALIPKAELEGEMSDQQIGVQARMMGKAMRKLTAIVSKSKTTVVFINQLREKIGMMFGDPTVTPGGRALKFYSSIRIKFVNVGKEYKTVDGVKTCIGHHIKCTVVKNKMAMPYKEASLYFLYNHGLVDDNVWLEKTKGKKK